MSDVITPFKRTDLPAVALVTGATGGLGSALSKSLTLQGVNVILSGRDLPALEALYDELDDLGTAEPALYPIDLAGAASTDFDNMAATLKSEYQSLGAIVHCAADSGLPTPIERYAANTWTTVMQVNVNSAFLISKACLPLMKETGNASITYLVDDKPGAFFGAYGVSKSAVVTLMKILADETEGFRDDNGHPIVAVNAVNPGRMRTPLRAKSFSGEMPEESPPPSDKVPQLLKVILRNDPELTGQVINLSE